MGAVTITRDPSVTSNTPAVRTYTISNDGRRISNSSGSFERTSYTIPVAPLIIGRWSSSRTRETLEFFEDGRMSSTMMRDGQLTTVWFRFEAPRAYYNGGFRHTTNTLVYWRYIDGRRDVTNRIFHVTDTELRLMNSIGLHPHAFNRLN